MTSLSASVLTKYTWRVEKFAEKYKSGEPFEINSGRKVYLMFDNSIYKLLQKPRLIDLQKLKFADAKHKSHTYKLSDFKKNAEFGGKPAGGGAGVGIEMREINSINKQFDEIRSKTGKKFVPIRVKSKIYQAVKCIKTPGNGPKSDFSILDENGNEIIWLSHKDGSTPKDFQQWGGMTEERIRSHPEAQEFVKEMQEKYPNGIPRATTIGKMIKDEKLKKYAVYGVDYGKALGQQNVSIVLQGPVKLKQAGNGYKFDANHDHDNGERILGNFEPVMMAIYKGDRSNFGIAGARFVIQPKSSRKVTEWIK